MRMKLMSLVLALGLLYSCGPTTYSTTSENAAFGVPTSIQTSFNAQYPGATNVVWSSYDPARVPIDWELTGWTILDADDYAVSYTYNGENYIAWYDNDGTWVGSSYMVRDNNLLPVSIHNMISQKYPGYTIDKIDKEMWKDQVAYEVKLKNADSKVKMLVDANGNIIKEKMKRD